MTTNHAQHQHGVDNKPSQDYTNWSPDDMIKRITELEKMLREKNMTYTSQTKGTPPKPQKSFNPTKHSTRHIALKFAYLGADYNGFEHHVGNKTPLPTIEEEIWRALVKCRLIFPPSLDGVDVRQLENLEGESVPVDWEGCEYSKCGRTDKGVSAFGQVIGIRVRSNRKAKVKLVEEQHIGNGIYAAPPKEAGAEDLGAHVNDLDAQSRVEAEVQSGSAAAPTSLNDDQSDELSVDNFDDIKDELQYIPMLNKVLPPTIRILAWCPSVPSNFDARFSCKERQYKYFFTNPAFLPIPNAGKEGYMNIEATQEAATNLLGSHDFRNFCKVDASKQLTAFTRRITKASVERVSRSEHRAAASDGEWEHGFDGKGPMELYTFTVQGSAFLWHQVRCMVGMLFLVGQGLEPPSIITELLDVENNPRKPIYEMASDKPLVLWDCMYSTSIDKGKFGRDEKPTGYVDRGSGADELTWIYADKEAKWGRSGLMENLWQGWRKAKIDEALAGGLMDLVAGQSNSTSLSVNGIDESEKKLKKGARARHGGGSTRVFEGDDYAKSRGNYISVMKKERMGTVEQINARYVARKPAKFAPKDDSGDEQ